MDMSKDEKKEPIFYKSKIISKSKELASYEEGCLSIPNQFAEIERPKKCSIQFMDYHGKEQQLEADGILRHVSNMKLII